MAISPRRVLVLLAAVPAVAACGSAASTPAAPSRTASPPLTTAPPARHPVDPRRLVLQLADVGVGYLPVSTESKRVTLAAELRGDTPAQRRADRAAYRGGYQTMYADSDQGAVLSLVAEYRRASAATIVEHDPLSAAQLAARFHAHPVAPPANAPGTNRLLFAFRVPRQGGSIPAYLYTWQRGSVIAAVFAFDSNLTLDGVMTLAERQDARITNA
jgi:hypothetical protein